MTAFTSSLFAWLLTYLIHSTVLLGLAWLVTRRHRLEPAASDLLWKVALLAGLVTGTIQSRLQLTPPAAVTLPVPTLPQAAPLRQPPPAGPPEPAPPPPPPTGIPKGSTSRYGSRRARGCPPVLRCLWWSCCCGDLGHPRRRSIPPGDG